MIDGSASRCSATPPATPAIIRSSRDRYSRSSTAILRVQGERAGVRAACRARSGRPRCRSPGVRPGRAVLDEAVAGVVVARDDALAGVQAEARALGGAQPDRAGVRLDRPGQSTRSGASGPSEPALSSTSIDPRSPRPSRDRRSRSRRSSGDRRRRGVAPARSMVALPGVQLDVEVEARRSAAGSAATCRDRRTARTARPRRADRMLERRSRPSRSIVGPTPVVVRPSTCQPSPGRGRDRQRRRSRAGRRSNRSRPNVPSRVGNGGRARDPPQTPPANPVDAAAQQAADHQPERRRDDEAADEVEARPAQDQADADADRGSAATGSTAGRPGRRSR